MADERSRLGRYETTRHGGEWVRAFLPPPLPPYPPLRLTGLLPLLDTANQAIGRLDGLTAALPDPHLFLYGYIRKEAVLSSQIEGTQSSLSDLLLFEQDGGAEVSDVREVSLYVRAMQHGLDRLAEGFPLSLRLLREIHQILLSTGRGSAKEPGEFRRSQNWIGGSRPGNAVYVPPPPDEVMPAMGGLERFLHDSEGLPVLLVAALAHVQFETIHPFLDGNRRLGRLLITLLLCERRVLSEPILYLSLYLKQNRQQYYDLLMRVREQGDWEAWCAFFLDGVVKTSEQGATTARRLIGLIRDDEARIGGLGRPASSALRVFQQLQRNPVATPAALAARSGLSAPTVTKSLMHLQELGLISEVTGRLRSRVFTYTEYLRVLDEGTEPL